MDGAFGPRTRTSIGCREKRTEMSGRCARPRGEDEDQKGEVGNFCLARNGEYTAAAERTPAIDSGGLGAQSERGREGKWRGELGLQIGARWQGIKASIARNQARGSRPEMAWLQFEDDDVSPFFYVFFSRF